jgi:hypothetical protein
MTAMTEGHIGYIDTPRQRNRRDDGVTWCADNGCFSDKWDQEKWWQFLVDNAHAASTCLFAVAPDVVGDAWRSHLRSYPWLEKIRALGYPVAYVMQDNAEKHPIPWADFDVAFIGGTTDWKLGAAAREIAAEAKRRGKWVHMGRVNSERRWRYAEAIGCDSADGTFLTFGPDANLPKVLAWNRNNDQPALFGGAA